MYYAQDILVTGDRSMKRLKLGMSYLREIDSFVVSPDFVPGYLLRYLFQFFCPARYYIPQIILFLFSFRPMPVQNVNTSCYIPAD